MADSGSSNAYTQSMTLLTARNEHRGAAIIERSVATPACGEMSDYFGCSGEMIQMCKRIALLEVSQMGIQASGQEMLSMYARPQ